MITSHEKGIVYNNVKWNESLLSTPNAGLHLKVVLHIWWDCHNSVLQAPFTKSDKYFSQLDGSKGSNQ